MRQLRTNVALLILALTPLIWDLCANLITGGSFSSAFREENLWILPFFLVSGTTYFLYNYREVAGRQRQGPPDKRLETLVATVPAANRTIRRLALTSGSGSANPDVPDVYANAYYGHDVPEPSPETLEEL